MSVTIYDAGLADEFHISHDGLPCTVWTRDGDTHYGPGPGQFRVAIFHVRDDGWREFHGITTVNAGDFHTLAGCPLARSDPPVNIPVTRNIDPDQPTLASAGGYDADGYDSDGYDEDGYDRDGYDPAGFNADGYNSDGYDEDGYDSDGFNEDGYDSDGYNEDREDRHGNPCPYCENCAEWMPGGGLTEVAGGSYVCDRCLERYYTWCDHCDGYYPDDDDEHDHESESDGGGCCESPQMKFTVRNDGYDPLASDTRFAIELPAGVISEQGINAITYYLSCRPGLYDLACDLDALGSQWQTREGNYVKRLSRHAYQRHQVKLSQEIMSQIGCIARDHSTAISVEIDVTRDLNQSDRYFCNDGSCWWGSYRESRCALKTNGGFGLRSLDTYGNARGRAWVLPLRLNDPNGRLEPTFDTMTPDAFVVFNGYGDLSGYAPARILAHMAGWTYRKIGFECSPMYVNAGGYLVAPEDVAQPYTDGSLYMSVEQHSHLFTTETERELVNA